MKPREFWLIYEGPYTPWISSRPLHSGDTSEEIHVIEYSAYENMRLDKEHLELIKQDYLKKIQTLTEQNKIMREALLRIQVRVDEGAYEHSQKIISEYIKTVLAKCGSTEPTTKQEEK